MDTLPKITPDPFDDQIDWTFYLLGTTKTGVHVTGGAPDNLGFYMQR